MLARIEWYDIILTLTGAFIVGALVLHAIQLVDTIKTLRLVEHRHVQQGVREAARTRLRRGLFRLMVEGSSLALIILGVVLPLNAAGARVYRSIVAILVTALTALRLWVTRGERARARISRRHVKQSPETRPSTTHPPTGETEPGEWTG